MRKMRKTLILALVFAVLFSVFLGGAVVKNVDPFALLNRDEHLWGPYRCDKHGPTMLGTLPIAIENLELYEPMGAVTGSHVLPVDHGYMHLKDYTRDDQNYEIRAPADGNILLIGNLLQWHTDHPELMLTEEYHVDYDIAIEHSCTLSSYMIHIDTLREDILAHANFKEGNVPGHQHASVYIPVKEGEVIGTVSGDMFDFSVHRSDITLPGFIFPEHYKDLRPKLHSVDIFDYFEEPARGELLAKNIRTVEPYGGKIDYDVEGRLIGNWFKENTKYHRGIIRDRYWDGHLAVVYDHITSSAIRVSIGDFNGKHEQFGVVGNAPDPAEVDIGTGPVKYELVRYHYWAGDDPSWRMNTFTENANPRNKDKVEGVALFQVLEDNKLKVEIFPGKRAGEVTGFTEGALIYER